MQVLQVDSVLQVRHSGRHLKQEEDLWKYPAGQVFKTHFLVSSTFRYVGDRQASHE